MQPIVTIIIVALIIAAAAELYKKNNLSLNVDQNKTTDDIRNLALVVAVLAGIYMGYQQYSAQTTKYYYF